MVREPSKPQSLSETPFNMSGLQEDIVEYINPFDHTIRLV